MLFLPTKYEKGKMKINIDCTYPYIYEYMTNFIGLTTRACKIDRLLLCFALEGWLCRLLYQACAFASGWKAKGLVSDVVVVRSMSVGMVRVGV